MRCNDIVVQDESVLHAKTRTKEQERNAQFFVCFFCPIDYQPGLSGFSTFASISSSMMSSFESLRVVDFVEVSSVCFSLWSTDGDRIVEL